MEKKEVQKRAKFIYDVTEYVASSSKDEAETKIVLTELVCLNKPMFKDIINTSGIDMSVRLATAQAVNMQSLLRLSTNKIRNLRHIN